MTRYEQNLTTVVQWTEIVNHYWHQHQGVLRDQEEFWTMSIHSMQDCDWWAWCEVEPALRIEHEEIFRRYPKLKEDTEEIRRRLLLGKSVSRQWGKGKNFTAFRTLMQIKDVINEISGHPTPQYTQHSTDPDSDRETVFERMFTIE